MSVAEFRWFYVSSYFDLSHCPCCGHAHFSTPVVNFQVSDNSLGSLLSGRKSADLPGFDLAAFSRVGWSVCGHCATIFARRRPVLAGQPGWYVPLFQLSEERNYDTYPLPAAYLAGKQKSAAKLFDTLDRAGVFASQRSVLHLRCGPGYLLQLIGGRLPDAKLYGLEYFVNPARCAREILPRARIAAITGPEPVVSFARQKFDLIIVNHFLTHANDPSAYVDYLKTLLADGGQIVFYNELDHALSLKSMSAYPRGLNFFHKQLFNRNTLSGFLKSRGLSVADVDSTSGAKPPKYIAVVCRKGEARPMPPGDSQAAVQLLENWSKKSRFYARTKWAIKPMRKLIRRAG